MKFEIWIMGEGHPCWGSGGLIIVKTATHLCFSEMLIEHRFLVS